MTPHRRQQLIYLVADIISAEMVWLCFLWFRWLVYDGKVFGVDTVLIPSFSFYPPLIAYPVVCICVYYLSGYYLRPFRRRLSAEFFKTLISAVIIGLIFFFIIIIDDQVESYQRYVVSLMVLIGLQFVLSYFPRLCITLVTRSRRSPLRVYTIRSLAEAKRMQRGAVDEVIVDLPKTHSERTLYEIINILYPLDIAISVVPRVYDMLTGAARIGEIEGQPLVRITDHKMSDSALCIKRAFDIVASLLAMMFLSPIYLLLSVLVAVTSHGPVIYCQERIGLHGKPFRILKFRTMYLNSEPDTPLLSGDNDPRITPVGHFMRKYRLDELPQMWNIFRGDMSIVGPRPERGYFIDQIVKEAPYYCLLYKIRPGLTSWGPIKVGYTDTIEKMVDRLNYDIMYMENMSIQLDLKILFFTIRVICDGKGK